MTESKTSFTEAELESQWIRVGGLRRIAKAALRKHKVE